MIRMAEVIKFKRPSRFLIESAIQVSVTAPSLIISTNTPKMILKACSHWNVAQVALL